MYTSEVLVPPIAPPSPPVLSDDDAAAYQRYALRSGVVTGAIITLLTASLVMMGVGVSEPFVWAGWALCAVVFIAGCVDGAMNHTLKRRVYEHRFAG